MERRNFSKIAILVAAVSLFIGTDGRAGETAPVPPGKKPVNGEYGPSHTENITADHSKFETLKQEFKSGPEVTKACLSCHTEAAKQIQETLHWRWIAPDDPEGKLGKAGLVVNNFCVTMPSNEPRCTSCHIGYGRKDKTFDLTAQEKVDCLVCHEQTGTYEKFPAGAGNPVAEPTPFPAEKKTYLPPEWNKVAQSVGRPTRRNCGVCHFFGGGGEGVKHGDLDSSMFKPNKALDVHMAVEDENFNCTRCHTTEKHSISGRYYRFPANGDKRNLLESDSIKRITCYSCHSETPHKSDPKLNDHTDKVACQSCHIPEFARVNSTKMMWDWSKAGARDGEGKPVKKMKDGRPAFDGMKGEFRWEKNVEPEYFWYNGVVRNVLLTDKIDPSQVVKLNYAEGSYDDPDARIYPFKVHRGKQPYDKVHKTMVAPKLFGPKGSGSYWSEYDWTTAISRGMEYIGLPFSGEHDFVETEYMFQTTHMVAPKEKALACTECHSKNGRLADLGGFYMPGRDGNKALNAIGWAGVIVSFLGVMGHGAGRMVARKRRDKNGKQHE
ncbi:MAG: cytochrome C [Deltaproteobacteria bacterium HGW-Deltaproteobacteria-21]|nr:MAG: cytochrome C [Deltaproteobacteria bacterium HGW-Deltaproteobacteria-21]